MHPSSYLLILFNKTLKKLVTSTVIVQMDKALADGNIVGLLQLAIQWYKKSQDLVAEIEILNKRHAHLQDVG